MFKQVLVAQWQTSKLAVGLLTLLSFCIPLLAVLYGGDLAGAGRERVGDWLVAADRVAQFLPFIALLVGLLLGTLCRAGSTCRCASGPVRSSRRSRVRRWA